ncbi:hypothetical protein Tco_0943734 [Tanacetum coccineum]
MDTTRAQQKALDDDLVAPAERLKIGKCNLRLSSNLNPRNLLFKWDDSMFTTIRLISKHQDIHVYGAILPQHLTNQAMLESKAYKTYHAYATGEKILKSKYVKNKADPESSPKKKSAQASKGKRLKTSTKVAKLVKKKQPATTSKEKGLNVLSEVALTEISWKSNDEKDDDEVSMSKDDDDNAKDDQNDDNVDNECDDDQDDDNEQNESDNDDDDFVHPKLSTFDEKERQDEEDKEEELSDDEAYDEETQGRDTEMADANVQATQVIEDTHVIITAVTPEVQQQSSSVSSGFISNILNPNPDTGIDSILNLNTESTSLVDVPVTTNAEMPPSSVTTLPPPPISIITTT